MKRLVSILILAISIGHAWACTAVVASGKVTTDGRPFIFKNRDSSDGLDNSLVTLKGSRFQFVGTVNKSSSASPNSIWYGHNEAGFAILNTLSYYFNSPTAHSNTSAGALMKKALGQCGTVDEFEALLQQTQSQSSVTLSTNFAVMDSLGNVAIFETSNKSYTKFDVNDETVAPEGYLVRTNFSFTSPYYETTNHVGEQRYKSACKYMEDTFGDSKINAVQLIHELPRYLYHGTKEINLWDEIPEDLDDVRYTYFNNFIPRFSSASAALMQGVAQGEPAAHTVSWIAIGWPCASFTVPIVITTSLALPEVVKRSPATYMSEMCTDAQQLKKRVFTIRHDGVLCTDSIDLSKLINMQETGLLQKMTKADEMVNELGNIMLNQFRAGAAADDEVATYYAWVDDYWREVYNQVTTAISSVVADAERDDAYYSIGGIRFNERPSIPGIYINKRHKVIVR